jgi:hypothetical protein
MQRTEKSALDFDGVVEPQFAPVRETFVANFEQNLELGAAVAVYHHGKLVVDLAGGLFARAHFYDMDGAIEAPVSALKCSERLGLVTFGFGLLGTYGDRDTPQPNSQCLPTRS